MDNSAHLVEQPTTWLSSDRRPCRS